MLRKLWNDEAGFLVSAELVLIFTLCFCGAAVGFAVVRDALAAELHDVSEAIGALNQSYNFGGLDADKTTGDHGSCAGSGYNDERDDCDCRPINISAVNGKDDPSAIGDAEGT